MNSSESAKQQIFRVRRQYNQWVNNQTLEDYALRFTAKKARKWSLSRVANTALGAISFLALEAIGGAITISFGFEVAITSILTVGCIIFLAGIPICFYAAKYGVDIDLLTRGAGFGYIGSTLTSLIYASFTFIFFALEAAIMAAALKLLFGLPLVWGYLACSVIIIPLVTHGITFISRFQLWTQPLWVILQLMPLFFIAMQDGDAIDDWFQFPGVDNLHQGELTLAYFGAASAILFSLIAQIGEQVDYLRFLPEKTKDNSKRWWTALMLAGPGWVLVGIIKMMIGSLLAYLVWHNGGTAREATDPANMYLIAFNYVIPSHQTSLIIAAIFVILCQIKINVTNSYAGSIAWSNFFSRLTHNHPGRVVWLVFNVAIALLLMELGIYQTFEDTLGMYAIVAVGWVATLVADLVICKPLGLSPKGIEFKRAHLYDINPVGVGSMIIASSVGAFCYLGLAGEAPKALSHFIAILCAFVCAPIIAIVTQGKYYTAREATHIGETELTCVVCQNEYEGEDMARCPAYGGTICSLCCSLDARCQDLCKPGDSIYKQVHKLILTLLPYKWVNSLNSSFSQFLVLFLLASSITGALLYLVYANVITDHIPTDVLLASTLWKVFTILMIVVGVICWLFVLAHDSRMVAQEESQTQNHLLMEEIKAHEKTDAQLQFAKEQAEAANSAKSRYLTGISHELRTPLNSILGYTQLLAAESSLTTQQAARLSIIKKSGEHLTDLIEGLLDISRIEAGRLDVNRHSINFRDLLDQLVYMFRLQSNEKGLVFLYNPTENLPDNIIADEKHLRQILINLLSNAIKFTETGTVKFSVSYRNQVARFVISDTGSGIPDSEIERAFKPFERIRTSDRPNVTGTGLGLTITRLLTEILGGELKLSNNPDGGLTASVALMLPSTRQSNHDPSEIAQPVRGYEGSKKVITVVDDDPMHRGLIGDALGDLGFIVLEAPDGHACLSMHEETQPDLYLIDISMPGMDGWKLTTQLRDLGYLKPIIILSANAKEYENRKQFDKLIDDYITKPVKLSILLNKLALLLDLSWVYVSNPSNKFDDNTEFNLNELPAYENLLKLWQLVNVGHLGGLSATTEQIKQDNIHCLRFITHMENLIANVQLDAIVTLLRSAMLKYENEVAI